MFKFAGWELIRKPPDEQILYWKPYYILDTNSLPEDKVGITDAKCYYKWCRKYASREKINL